MNLREKIDFLSKYGPWAVVTGASSGIGRALALELGKMGFDLVLVGRNAAALHGLGEDIQSRFFTQVKVITADLSPPAGNQKVVEETSGLIVGLLVASAGFGTSGKLMESDLSDELEMMQVNCHSPLVLSHELGNKMISRRKGGIIFLSSIVAFQGVPYAAHYAATKAYIQSLAEGLAREIKPHQVDVLAASPGPVESGFGKRAKMSMGKAMRPEDIAEPILAALGKKVTVYPGFLTQFLTASLSLLPRWGKVRVMEQVMGGFTKRFRPQS